MADKITNYQCPACTGPLHFSGESGRLECEYCGSKFEVAEIEALYAEKDDAAADAFTAEESEPNVETEGEWDTSDSDWGSDAQNMRAYNCPSCGAEMICEETTAATSCPYCGNPSIIPGQFEGTLKPDFVIPFQLDKEAAKEALKTYYKGKKYLPKVFSTENQLEEIKGVYVPFWLFDGKAEGEMGFQATRTSVFRQGNDMVTKTDHYYVQRTGTAYLEKLPVDASTKMPDDYMDSIEPFDYQELKEFSTAYLPGFLAEKYDVSVDKSMERAEERARNTVLECLRSDVQGYQTCVCSHQNILLKREKAHYALLPVWVLNTKWNEQSFLFAVNGQTGKTTGVLPIDWKQFWLKYALLWPILAAVIAFLIMMLGGAV